jgi:hypothetical protein
MTRRSILVLALIGAFPPPGPVLISDHDRADPAVAGCLTNGNPALRPIFKDSEPSAAVDPRDRARIAAVWQTSDSAGSVIQFSLSRDGGASWAAPRSLPINACAGGPVPRTTRASDPWVSIGPEGRIYAAGIAFSVGEGKDAVNALVVAVSDDDGRTWRAAPAAVAPDSVFQDNVAVVADPSRPGTAYLATTRYHPSADGKDTFGPIGFTRTDDGGASWAPIRQITPDVAKGRISAPVIVVDPRSGALRAFYFRSAPGIALIGTIASTDGGVSWGAETRVAPVIRGAWQPPHPIDQKPFILAGDIVQAARDPGGNWLVAYPTARSETDHRLEVAIVSSKDGVAWSRPVRVARRGLETTWLPALAADSTAIGVAYFGASFRRVTSGRAPISLHLARLKLTGTGLRVLSDSVLDRANLAWPGDYHALVATTAGFRSISVRSTASPTERLPFEPADARVGNPTDVFVH